MWGDWHLRLGAYLGGPIYLFAAVLQPCPIMVQDHTKRLVQRADNPSTGKFRLACGIQAKLIGQVHELCKAAAVSNNNDLVV